ncbi:MAG: single-stranded DNA-binding protein [Treponema sp.]|nr:single-stranded DNA-binding protein [Treponema sp.]
MAGSDLNSVALVGRLTRDAELSYLQSGTAVAAMSVAVNRSRKDGDQWVSEVNYFDVSYFGKPAESLKQYLTKGKQIAVQGSLKQDRWEKDGQKFSKIRIMANSIELLGGRSDAGSSSSYGGSAGQQMSGGYTPRPSAQNYQAADSSVSDESFGGDSSGFPEDIPF